MDWTNFKPKSEEELAPLRNMVVFLNGENPFEPVRPIQGVAPRKCRKCDKTLPFISNENTSVCPGGCKP